MADRSRINSVEVAIDVTEEVDIDVKAGLTTEIAQLQAALTQIAEIKAGAKRLLVDCDEVEIQLKQKLKHRLVEIHGSDSDSSDCHPL